MCPPPSVVGRGPVRWLLPPAFIARVHDGVRFEEVSLGYPREWGARGRPEPLTRQILPAPDAPQVRWVRGGDGMPRLARPGESAPELEEER